MEGEEVQPTRISKDEYLKFKQWVQDVHGKTRGHLSTEIENALREYRQPDDAAEPLSRIEQDIATIKAQLAEAESDGGVAATPPAPADDDSHTRTPAGKPSENASRAKKVEYLIEQKYDREGGSIPLEGILSDVKELYSFGDRTAEKYVQPVINELDAKRHPNNSSLLLWGKTLEDIREKLESDDG